MEQLKKAGILENKKICSTADLYDYQLTEKGKKYLRAVGYELILVKKNRQQALMALPELEALL